MKLYLVRHGQTEGNLNNIYQDNTDTLSAVGKEQARILGERFKKIPLDAILSSPILRAFETTQEIAKHHKLAIQKIEELTERRWPKELAGKSFKDPSIIELRNFMKQKELEDPSWHYSDEESFNDLVERAFKFLKIAEGMASNHKHVLVVSHARFLKLLLGVILWGREANPHVFQPFFYRVSMNNTSITVCEYDKEAEAQKRWHIVTLNDHAHLGEYRRQPH